MKLSFYETPACQNRLHCRRCRDTGPNGLSWRQQLANHLSFDVHGECPHGVPWDFKPVAKSRGLGDTIAKITTAIGIKPCSGCKKRQELLNKLVPYKANNINES